jgi:hypothetical protein
MEQVVKNDYFEVSVDPVLNRFYFKVVGFWDDASIGEDFVIHALRGLDMLKDGCTGLVNMLDLKTPPEKIKASFVKIQKHVVSKNPGKIAEVIDSKLIEVNLDETKEKSGVETNVFSTVTDAVKYLGS